MPNDASQARRRLWDQLTIEIWFAHYKRGHCSFNQTKLHTRFLPSLSLSDESVSDTSYQGQQRHPTASFCVGKLLQANGLGYASECSLAKWTQAPRLALLEVLEASAHAGSWIHATPPTHTTRGSEKLTLGRVSRQVDPRNGSDLPFTRMQAEYRLGVPFLSEDSTSCQALSCESGSSLTFAWWLPQGPSLARASPPGCSPTPGRPLMTAFHRKPCSRWS